jgi:hypothetical protein
VSFPVEAHVEEVDREKEIAVVGPGVVTKCFGSAAKRVLATVTVPFGVTYWVRQSGSRIEGVIRRINGWKQTGKFHISANHKVRLRFFKYPGCFPHSFSAVRLSSLLTAIAKKITTTADLNEGDLFWCSVHLV